MTQPTLKQWLKRGRTAQKRRKPLSPVSQRRATQLREYAKRRKAFLAAHSFYEAGVSGGLIPPSNEIACMRKPTDVHHKSGRGKSYLDESTWIAVCRPCHTWINAHPKEARELGLLK